MWDVPFAEHIDFHYTSEGAENDREKEPLFNWSVFLKVWALRTI